MTEKVDLHPNLNSEFDAQSLQFHEALQRIDDAITPVTGFEQCAVGAALGRVLSADVISAIDVPPHDNSAMDGYAVRGDDLPASGEATLRIIGECFAGHPFTQTLTPGTCVRIMTGGVMPAGSDTVIMQEHAQRKDDRIVIGSTYKRGQHARKTGDDIKRGAVVLPKGRKLTPADVGLCASLGIASVQVYRRIRVAFFSTGDELRSLGEALEPGQIYDSNRYTVHAMLTRLGVDILDMGVIRDRRVDIQNAFVCAAQNADALITSGGVSVGEADFVRQTLEALGRVNFWKIAMKPGRPLAFGTVQNAYFFGLPGNPVSAMVTFYQFVQPALRRLMGQHTVANPT
ncbi:MAG: molybdopterin molybdotransferase MoeA, partial [Gammaproteobacteria bacterium]|nr:molybdopterin molybdotransferase MoeA [Gammaproteobacteria bacterium]